jgi:clorobiocin/coumermycin A biosynthesis protein CloN7/CouN7
MREMSPPTSHTLDVPGARLYFEVRGSGPPFMLIGHPMDASGFAGIASALAEAFTVVTYDPRGFGRSTIDDPDQDGEPVLLADDVRRVLEAAVGKVPAHVFGSSGGAVTGLALVARHPEHVGTLIAHEAPLALLLPEAEQARAAFHRIDDTYRESGMSAAWQAFGSFTGLTIAQQDPAADPPAPSPQEVATSTRFFEHGLLPIALYQPDFAALQAAPTRLIVAGGTASRGQFPQRTSVALAARLGTPLMDFPGGHAGFTTEPGEFASVLRRAVA